MKNAFISPVKLFSFRRYLKFCSDFFGHVGKRLNEKAKVNFKVYDFIHWELIITIHALPNISRSKGNQEMKFCQLVEYNMGNILFGNHTQDVGQKLVPDSFLKSQN